MLEKFLFHHESLSALVPPWRFFSRSHSFELAFTHKSYANEHKGTEDNERLEFLEMGFRIGHYRTSVSVHFPKTRRRTHKISECPCFGASLSRIAKSLDLESFFVFHEEKKWAEDEKKNPILANVFEALLVLFISILVFLPLKSSLQTRSSASAQVIAKNFTLTWNLLFKNGRKKKSMILLQNIVFWENLDLITRKNFLCGSFLGRKKWEKVPWNEQTKAEVLTKMR